jgi:hypothetical protein
MTAVISYSNAPDLTADDYIVIGLATCFVKEDGEVHQVDIIEPIPSASLETLFKGTNTSYKLAYATTLGSLMDGEKLKVPFEFPESAQLCHDFMERVIAAARTYKRREISKSLIPLGTNYTDFKYSTDRKRVLNATRSVTKEDNIKQHPNTHKVL